MLHHVANGFARGVDRDDLMQELLLAVWRAVPAYRGAAGASTFLYRVAHNAALAWCRARKSYAARLDRFETLSPEAPLPAASRDPAGREREALAHLYACIRVLPPVDRSLVLLQLEGLSYAEIAEVHGLSETNVGARLSRIRQNLTASLKHIAHELR